MNKDDKRRLSELSVQRQMLGYRFMYYALRNIPAVYRHHPIRSTAAVAIICSTFLAAYLFITNTMPPGELDGVKDVPIAITTILCCVLFLFGQAAGFVEEWQHGRDLGQLHDELSREIKEFMGSRR